MKRGILFQGGEKNSFLFTQTIYFLNLQMLMCSKRESYNSKEQRLKASTDLPFLFSSFSASVTLCCGTQTEVFFYLGQKETTTGLKYKKIFLTDCVQFIMNSLEE